jgi:CBS-domain-containing membrane protein
VGEIAFSCDGENTITPDTDAMKALSLMNRTGAGCLMVVEDGQLKGILARRDLLNFFATKVELEGERAALRKSHTTE